MIYLKLKFRIVVSYLINIIYMQMRWIIYKAFPTALKALYLVIHYRLFEIAINDVS